MTILTTETSAADTTTDTAATTAAAVDTSTNTAVRPDDAMADAAARLFDGKATDIKADVAVESDKAAETEGEKAAETDEEKAAREEAEKAADERYGAPEGDADYADFVLPEGAELDAEGATDLKGLAKELNLSQASAQKLVDKLVAKQTRDAEAAQANVNSIREGWQTATRADKEFGGDKLNTSLAVAQKALKQFGSPELNELVVGAGLGDHPEFIRLMVRVGNAVSEAPIVNGGPSVTGDAASVMYPNHPRQK